MKQAISFILKGMAMGAANVIPGVSGGTIALITGIFERLIKAIKSVDLSTIKLVFQGKFKDAWTQVDGTFLTWIFLGVGASIFSLAFLFKRWLEDPVQSVWLMAFFFGLILISIISVGKTIEQWKPGTILSLVIGFVAAASIALLTPASENDAIWFLLICGVIAMCSMILPGLSGSFVLIIMGNYKLIMLDAVSELNVAILTPVVIGAVLGLIVFSRVLSWVFEHHRDVTIASLTGFIAGSLAIIWPWKNETFLLDAGGQQILKKGEPIVSGYEWFVPDVSNTNTLIGFGFILLGAVALWALERYASIREE